MERDGEENTQWVFSLRKKPNYILSLDADCETIEKNLKKSWIDTKSVRLLL